VRCQRIPALSFSLGDLILAQAAEAPRSADRSFTPFAPLTSRETLP
jgi:hypothetical protein